MLWFAQQKPAFFQATKQEQVETIDRLISQGTVRSGYYLILLLATLIVTPGLFLNNMPIVIGGMILAPLLIPVLSLSLSLVTGTWRGALRSLRILALSFLMVVGTAAVLAIVMEHAMHAVPWYPQGMNPGIYIFVAFCSGIAGAFAWIKEDMSPAIAGVATAVSLLPPLCIAGISAADLQWQLMQESLIIFAANFLGICMAAFLVFWLLGFLRAGKEEEKILDRHAVKA